MKKAHRPIQTNPITLIEKEKTYLQHVAKLNQIATDRKPNKDSQKAMENHHTRLYRQQESSRRKKTQQLLDIQKDNDRLLERLLKINAGTDKKQVAQMKAQKSLPEIQSPFENGRAKSLNKVSRKHDLIRIINDNVKLTERIVFQESNLAKNKLDRDYANQRKISDRIRKFKLQDDKTAVIGHSGIKVTQEMRIKSMIPVLTRMPISLPSLQNSITSRSSSVPRQYNEQSLSSRFHHKGPETFKPSSIPKTERSSYAPVMNRVQSVEVLHPKQLETDPHLLSQEGVQSDIAVITHEHNNYTEHHHGEFKEESQLDPRLKESTTEEELQLIDQYSEQKVTQGEFYESDIIHQSTLTEQKTLNEEETIVEENNKSKQDTIGEVVQTTENIHQTFEKESSVQTKQKTRNSELANESIQTQEQEKSMKQNTRNSELVNESIKSQVQGQGQSKSSYKRNSGFVNESIQTQEQQQSMKYNTRDLEFENESMKSQEQEQSKSSEKQNTRSSGRVNESIKSQVEEQSIKYNTEFENESIKSQEQRQSRSNKQNTRNSEFVNESIKSQVQEQSIKRKTRNSEFINESIPNQEQSKVKTNTVGYATSFEYEEDFSSMNNSK